MRLIDAVDIKKRGDCYLPEIRNAVANILRHTKTVKDAVVVVMCNDCKHFDGECCGRYADETMGYWHSTQPEFFCAVAERREECPKKSVRPEAGE